MKRSLTSEAEDELTEAALWYEGRREGLGVVIALMAKIGTGLEDTLRDFGYRTRRRHLAGLVDEHL